MTRPHQIRSARALFEPTQAGALKLANRIVMAPLTRNRAAEDLSPGPFAAEYYAQRASAGLIIAEATQVSAQGQGYANTPGCYTDAQVKGWKKVTDAVHARGGTIVVQLWHTGRVSHTSFQKDGQAPVGPSAIRANTKTFIAGTGFVDVSTPRALELQEIPGIVEDFRNACARAIEAGFDGVELHGAHGYLLDAFLRDGTNHRADAYGGSIENRARLLLDVATACAGAIGAERLGVRLSPVSTAGDSHDSNPQALFNHVVESLNPLGLAYLHVVEGETGGARDSIAFDYEALSARFDGPWMVNNGYDRRMAIDAVVSGRADLVSFGRPFIANPDLAERLSQDAPLNKLMGPETFYGGGARGYTDYPALAPDHATARPEAKASA
ncbi:alkene reductase [Rhodoblastus sphagnicola]|uniref:Alkene reductase n=1 Tax=Rhodoblastus sphagnicola TaxID=333368 RepID=A0A2S6MTX1_9HYPH|nr:alkene reductase [Rhodoblastus sphagnicola]MBB4199741.1 N-ethylmaleimide reductase [Rhodoblastus sphagnicola]PPQ25807.1 alkene reductase [Rhodoblastus sphagnicola]